MYKSYDFFSSPHKKNKTEPSMEDKEDKEVSSSTDLVASNASLTVPEMIDPVKEFVMDIFKKETKKYKFDECLKQNKERIKKTFATKVPPYQMEIIVFHKVKKTGLFTFEKEEIDVLHPVTKSEDKFYRLASVTNQIKQLSFYLEDDYPKCFFPETESSVFCFYFYVEDDSYAHLKVAPVRQAHAEMSMILGNLTSMFFKEEDLGHYKNRLALYIHTYKGCFRSALIGLIKALIQEQNRYSYHN
jgi:hypothetical protein